MQRAVLSHLHFDHCGGLTEVPDARIVVQSAEWEAAQDPIMAEFGVYHPPDFHTGQDVERIDGRVDLFGDGSVVAIPTPGHSAGHQSLLIEGRMLLVGDACYCQLALDEDALPPVLAGLRERPVATAHHPPIVRSRGAGTRRRRSGDAPVLAARG